MLLATIQALVLLHVAVDKSEVFDEPIYLNAAARLVRSRDFHFNCEAPVLPKWAFGAALALTSPRVLEGQSGAPAARKPPGRRPGEIVWRVSGIRDGAELRRALLGARVPSMLVTVLAGLLLWRTARRYGELTGLAAQVLWCFSPTVLASGALATLDGWCAGLLCAVQWACFRACDRSSSTRLAMLGGLSAAAAACKITCLLGAAVALGVTLWVAFRRHQRRLADLPVLVGAFCGAFVVILWMIYGFSFAAVDPHSPCAFGGAGDGRFGPVPFPAWIAGALFQSRHAAGGHTSYLFGEIRTDGWWTYYLVCLALKTTLGAQGLVVLRGVAILRRPPTRDERLIDGALLCFPALLLLLLSAKKLDINIMYLLPAFPPFLLWCARGLNQARAAFARFGAIVFGILLLFSVVESAMVHPHYLMFFNVWAGGPDLGPRYLVHREDWGQDKRRLGEWQRAEGLSRIYYTWYGGDPAMWGISAEENIPCTPSPGVYALHAVEAHRPKYTKQGCLDWLTVEPPDERLGHSIYIYRVDAARASRLEDRQSSWAPFWRTRRP